jgi:hypothetical protein
MVWTQYIAIGFYSSLQVSNPQSKPASSMHGMWAALEPFFFSRIFHVCTFIECEQITREHVHRYYVQISPRPRLLRRGRGEEAPVGAVGQHRAGATGHRPLATGAGAACWPGGTGHGRAQQPARVRGTHAGGSFVPCVRAGLVGAPASSLTFARSQWRARHLSA